MWVCLRVRKNIIIKGTMQSYQPGDWIEVGKHLGLGWVKSGEAYVVDNDDGRIQATAGILVIGTISPEYRTKLSEIAGLQWAFADQVHEQSLPFTETLVFRPDFELRLDLMVVGFNLLKKWQLAVPLWDYETLASQVGSESERERTKAVIRDLRVPLRDTRLMFVRRSDSTRRLFDQWRAECTDGAHEQLAFLRALYTEKPLICDLPASWTGRVR